MNLALLAVLSFVLLENDQRRWLELSVMTLRTMSRAVLFEISERDRGRFVQRRCHVSTGILFMTISSVRSI